MPMQGPQALSKMRAPASIILVKAPFAASIDKTCLEPGAMTRDTFSATVLPSRIAATFIISAKDALVQLPIAT